MEVCNEIAAALAKAQTEMGNPAFDSQNPHFRSKFASLAAVRNAVIPVLAKHGIACVQNITTGDNTILCTTTLLHSSGQAIAFGPLTLPVAKADAQGFGSAATYARRYALMAVAGVVGDDDDDGNAAVSPAKNGNGAAKITKEQAEKLRALIGEVGADQARFMKYLKVDSLEAIPAVAFDGAVAALEKKRGES